MSANIILILEHMGVPPALAPLVDAAKSQLASYRSLHRAWHWPVKDGRSTMANAPLLWRHRFVEIDADADCTCLVQMARRDPGLDDAIIADLTHYRADGARFRLPGFQRGLTGADGSFLTWFPPTAKCHPGKIETIDAGADANILWYLASIGRLDTPGAAETTAFLAAVLSQGLALADPFRVSIYYPSPAVLLYLISRAAVLGRIGPLLSLRDAAVSQLGRCPATSALDVLCREAAARLWGAGVVGDEYLPAADGRGSFYIGPLLAWPLQRLGPLRPAAENPLTHIRFRSEALECALRMSIENATP
jgi:hypothetical protein